MVKEKVISTRDKVRVKSVEVMKKKRVMLAQAKELFKELSDIPYAYIKGEVLSLMAYGDFGFRDYHDIDILINRSDMKKVENIMKRNGFEQCVYEENGVKRELTRREKIMMENSHQTAPFTKRFGNNELVEIDINYDIFWSEYSGKRIAIDELLADTRILNLYDYPVKILNPIDNFIQVCLHHYKEMNAVYCFKLKNPISVVMFQDIAMLFQNQINVCLSELIEYSKEQHINQYIYYMLYYTNKIFPSCEIDEVLDSLYDETVDGILDYYGLTERERRKWRMTFSERLDNDDLFEKIKVELDDEFLRKVDLILSIL